MEPNTSLKIFLVDDEPYCLNLYEKQFHNLGYRSIHTFGNSADCLNQLTLEPDIIFLDYNMDNLNGIDILKKIKRFNPDIIVFFVSGQEAISVAVNALKYGAFDYIVKQDMNEERIRVCLEKVAGVREILQRKKKSGRIRRLLSGFGLSLLVIVGMALCLASCRTQNLFESGDVAGVKEPATPLSSGRRVPAKQGKAPMVATDSSFYRTTLQYEYRIRKDDKISISVWDNDDAGVGSSYGIYNSNEVYGKWLMVDARGIINVPRIGALEVEGLTVIAAEDSLRERYAQWIKTPIVDVKVLNKEVVVMGEMKAPGKLLLEKDNNSLVEVLARAGDFDFYANKHKIQVIRVDSGQVKEIFVDLTRMDNYFSRNIRIIPGDIVYVPAKKGKDFDKRASSILPFVSIVTAFAIIYKTFL